MGLQSLVWMELHSFNGDLFSFFIPHLILPLIIFLLRHLYIILALWLGSEISAEWREFIKTAEWLVIDFPFEWFVLNLLWIFLSRCIHGVFLLREKVPRIFQNIKRILFQSIALSNHGFSTNINIEKLKFLGGASELTCYGMHLPVSVSFTLPWISLLIISDFHLMVFDPSTHNTKLFKHGISSATCPIHIFDRWDSRWVIIVPDLPVCSIFLKIYIIKNINKHTHQFNRLDRWVTSTTCTVRHPSAKSIMFKITKADNYRLPLSRCFVSDCSWFRFNLTRCFESKYNHIFIYLIIHKTQTLFYDFSHHALTQLLLIMVTQDSVKHRSPSLLQLTFDALCRGLVPIRLNFKFNRHIINFLFKKGSTSGAPASVKKIWQYIFLTFAILFLSLAGFRGFLSRKTCYKPRAAKFGKIWWMALYILGSHFYHFKRIPSPPVKTKTFKPFPIWVFIILVLYSATEFSFLMEAMQKPATSPRLPVATASLVVKANTIPKSKKELVVLLGGKLITTAPPSLKDFKAELLKAWKCSCFVYIQPATDNILSIQVYKKADKNSGATNFNQLSDHEHRRTLFDRKETGKKG